jgi:hypothetical protein
MNALRRWLRKRGILCLALTLTLSLLSLTFCSRSYASASLNESGDVVMTVEDARLLLGEVRALRAENTALHEALTVERGDTDRLIADIAELNEAFQEERESWRDAVKHERKKSWQNGLTMLVVGLAVGAIF